jgi:hypothetical protein
VVAGLDPSLSSLSWRLPFILGGLLGLMAAYLRRQLQETPLFERAKSEGALSRRVPLAVIVSQYRKQCLFTVALVFVLSSTSGVYFQFLPVYESDSKCLSGGGSDNSACQQADMCHQNPCGGAGDGGLEVFGQSAAAIEPGERSLDHPAPW